MHRSMWHEVGVSDRDLTSEAFMRVFPGYHAVVAAPPTLSAMSSVLQRHVVPGAVLSHTTAALHWGMPLPARLENRVGVLLEGATTRPDGSLLIPSTPSAGEPGEHRAAPSRAKAPRGPRGLPLLHCRVVRASPSAVGARENVAIHRSDLGFDTSMSGGLEVTSPLSTLLDLATMMPVWDVTATIDAVVSGHTVVRGVTLDDIREFAAQASGRPGVVNLRRAVASARHDTRSPGETMTRLLVVEAGFDEPVPNLEVSDPRTGRARYIDNAWAGLKIGLEYDGDGHRTRRGQWQDDEARRDELASYGWHLARTTTRDVHRPARFLRRLARTMVERGGRAPSERQIDAVVVRLHEDPPSLWIDRSRSDPF